MQDEESWLEAIKGSTQLRQSGAWYELCYADGTCEKFQATKWVDKLKEEKFKARVLEVMDEETILRFDKRIGEAADFYDTDEKIS